MSQQQSDAASKPMAVTVYRLTSCPHCNAANGVTAIRCWSCDQPLSDKRWTGEVSAEELSPARDPALTDADFTFLDNDLLARQKQAAVEDAVATANTFATTRTLGHSAAPALPHRPQVVERVDDDRSVDSRPQAGPKTQHPRLPASQAPGQRQMSSPAMPIPRAQASAPSLAGDELPPAMFRRPMPAPQPSTPPQAATTDGTTAMWQPPGPQALRYDQPLDYDVPLPFAEAAGSASHDESGSGSAEQERGGSRFSVRNSAIGEAPGAAFRKRRPVEAIVLTVVLGAGLYAYLQPSAAPDDAPRIPSGVNRAPGIDAETQRLLDMSAPAATGAAASPAPAPAPAVVTPPAPTAAPAPRPVAAPAPTLRTPTAAPAVSAPAAATARSASAVAAPAAPVVPVASVVSAAPLPTAVAPTVRAPTSPATATTVPEAAPPETAARPSTSAACAPHVAALGLC